MPKPVHVHDEIGPLRRVVVHRPGDEIVEMTQQDLERLLFDDLLSPVETTREHMLLVQMLEDAGAEVLELGDLLRDAITRAPASALEQFVRRTCELAGVRDVASSLLQWPAADLARALIVGVHWSELEGFVSPSGLKGMPPSLARIRARLFDPHDLALPPLPNTMFMRDPCIALYDRIIVGRMATGARAREPSLVAFALEWSEAGIVGELAQVDPSGRAGEHSGLEGGDVLVVGPELIVIGCSQRSRPATIEHFARDLVFPRFPRLARVLVVMLPLQRSMMHLDTVLTSIDRTTFLGHAPLLERSLAEGGLGVVELEPGRAPRLHERASVVELLRDALGSDIHLVPCGGSDRLHQAREQWTDGANALCLAPGKLVLYSRNVHTIRALAELGFAEVRLSTVQPEALRRELVVQGMAAERTVFGFSGSELSRGRGGGRCLTLPLVREGRYWDG